MPNLTGDLTGLLGELHKSLDAWVVPYSAVVVDGAQIRLGSADLPVDLLDGTFTVDLPEGFYLLRVRYYDPAQEDRVVWESVIFELTADIDFTDIIAAVPVLDPDITLAMLNAVLAHGVLDDTAVAAAVNGASTATRIALQEEYAPGVNVRAHGAAPANTANANTTAFNAAIDANAGGIVYVPAGTYQINADHAGGKSILLDQPGTSLVLHPGAVLQAATNALDRYSVVRITAADCTVKGGTIKGDLLTHTGGTGEWGYCIEIMEAAHRTRIEDIRLMYGWGDGLVVADGTPSYTTGARPADVQINNVVCDNNRRQGISVVAALRLQINGGSFINTGQTSFIAPGAGIAFEPNAGGLQKITDAVVTGAVCSRNKGRGMYFHAQGCELTATVNGVRAFDNDADGYGVDSSSEIIFNGCHAENNGVTAGGSFDGFIIGVGATLPVTLNGCTAVGNTRMGFITSAPDTQFAACNSYGNGWAGLASTGARTVFSACRASGNNQVSSYYGNFALDAGGNDAHLVGCTSEAGQGATKAANGFHIFPTVTGAQLSGCTAKGAFTTAAFSDAGTGTIALPKPGVAKQTGVAVSAAGIHAALVNLGLIT
jgi:hypothetical protein